MAGKKVPRETILKQVGQVFLLRRNDLNLQLLEVADRSGITTLTISKLEKGKLENTSVETLEKIATALGMEISITATLKVKK
jgi:transcriptional regulator with XRE-family HTH domain